MRSSPSRAGLAPQRCRLLPFGLEPVEFGVAAGLRQSIVALRPLLIEARSMRFVRGGDLAPVGVLVKFPAARKRVPGPIVEDGKGEKAMMSLSARPDR